MKINGNIQVEITFDQIIQALEQQLEYILQKRVHNPNRKITSIDIENNEVYICYRDIYDTRNGLYTEIRKQKLDFSHNRERELFICIKNLIDGYDRFSNQEIERH